MNASPNLHHRSGLLLIAAEALLILLSIAATAQFGRLFGDNTWVRPLVVMTVVAHLVAIAMRRLGRGLALSGLASLVALVLTTTWYHYWDTTTAGIPTGNTRTQLDLDLTAAWNLFGEVSAPTEPTVGFLILCSLAIWIGVYLADWAAFRLWSSLEAVLPALSIFVFVAFFGTDTNLGWYTAALVATIVAFLLVHRIGKLAMDARWLADRGSSGTSALLRAGAVVGALGVLAATLIGPDLPGADADAIVDVDPEDEGPSSRVVISPIVDIRGRLVEQQDVEVFTVRSNEKTYWRLTSLPFFDGKVWGSRGQYSTADGNLPVDIASGTTSINVTADISISQLAAVWMPAPFEPRSLSGQTTDEISYEPNSATLIVDKTLESSDNISYTVGASLPRFDPAVLQTIDENYPDDIRDTYLQLPDDFSATATALAQDITAGAIGPYEKALALQQFFRENFEYSLDVGPGHSSSRIDNFLANRVGYCEQFAGSFAAMARSIGLPARVAVGFTWGDQDPNDPTLFSVRGEHAHAWPEVYMPSVGWVSFEPTPSRGAPGAEAWTGVPEQQAGTGDQSLPTPTPETVEVPEGPAPTPLPSENPFDIPEGSLDLPVAAAGDDGDSGLPGWLSRTLLIGGAALLAIGAYVGGMLALSRNRRTRRFNKADNNRDRVLALWRDSTEAIAPLGVKQKDIETDIEFARRAQHDGPIPGKALEKLGQASTTATFGPGDPDETLVDTSRALNDEVRAAVERQTTASQRLRDQLHPRQLVKR